MGGEGIEVVREVRLLGLIIDESLTFNTHVKTTCAKAYRILQAVGKSGQNQLGPGHIDHQDNLYCSDRTSPDVCRGCLGAGNADIATKTKPTELPHPADEPRLSFEHYKTELRLDEQADATNIYTDGSKTDDGVGAAVVLRRLDRELKTVKIKLATYCTVFQAEMVALHKAIQMATKVISPKVNLCSDSRSALEDIVSGRSLNPLVVQTRKTLKDLSNYKEVRLFWIKAHVGHEGNERADQLAKEAATDRKRKPDFDKCPVSTIKRLLRADSVRRWEEEYDGGHNSLNHKNLPPNRCIRE
ncbi:unnamed protein product [Leptosia nina]|uniref:ribonuclease H n=1 Tax=Leptosia nina TaxID=320188 RepID=A0AAV1JE55_9NEOP